MRAIHSRINAIVLHILSADMQTCCYEIHKLVDEVCRIASVPSSKVVLSGFSQGSMIALDAALTLPKQTAGK